MNGAGGGEAAEPAVEDPFAAAGPAPTGHDQLDAAEAAFAEAVAAKAEAERALTEERKEQAERDLDSFYDELTDKKAMKQATNREREEALAAAADTDTAAANPFARVVSLINTDAAADGADLSVMRSLLVRLKNDPKRTASPTPPPADAAAAAAANDN